MSLSMPQDRHARRPTKAALASSGRLRPDGAVFSGRCRGAPGRLHHFQIAHGCIACTGIYRALARASARLCWGRRSITPCYSAKLRAAFSARVSHGEPTDVISSADGHHLILGRIRAFITEAAEASETSDARPIALVLHVRSRFFSEIAGLGAGCTCRPLVGRGLYLQPTVPGIHAMEILRGKGMTSRMCSVP